MFVSVDSYETYDGTSSSEVELPEPTPPPAAPTTPAPAGLVDEMSSTEEYHTVTYSLLRGCFFKKKFL